MSRPPVRMAAGLVLLALGALDLHALVLNLRAHSRVRERAFDAVRAEAVRARPALGALVAAGGPAAIDAALQRALALGLGDAAEAFTVEGRRLMAVPHAAPTDHWPSPDEVEALWRGTGLVVPSALGETQRVLCYVGLTAAGHAPVVLRLSAPTPSVAEDLRERQKLFLGHAAALLLLLVLAAVVLLPAGPPPAFAAPQALFAYEEAMQRLRHHGDEMTVLHAAERRRMEDEMQERAAFARAGELTADMAHEVRNGLGTILGYARLLERAASGAEAEHARSIRQECETLETVVRRFMEFVKQEELRVAPFDLGRMLERVAARESRRPGARVEVEARNAGSLPADEEMLERAFENLVRNAREAAGERGGVRVTASREASSVLVTVDDDGPGLGVDAAAATRPFVSTKAGGLGLGLPMAVKIIRLHGGDLLLERRVPRGVRVSVRLPASAGEAVTDGNG